MADRSLEHKDLWTIYRKSAQYREQILHWFDLKKNLPILSWKDQLIYLENCPEDIIKAHQKLIKDEAKRKLGLSVSKAKETEWLWTALC